MNFIFRFEWVWWIHLLLKLYYAFFFQSWTYTALYYNHARTHARTHAHTHTHIHTHTIRGSGYLNEIVVPVLPSNSYTHLTNTAWVSARLCKLQKGYTRLTTASDKVYQLLAHGRWFSPGSPASSTTKTGRNDIAEILLKVALNTINKSINHSQLEKHSKS